MENLELWVMEVEVSLAVSHPGRGADCRPPGVHCLGQACAVFIGILKPIQ